jgi:H+/Cl- antiporter ClcA
MKHINIVKTLCLFLTGYFLINLIMDISYMIWPTDSQILLFWGILIGLVTIYAFFKSFNYFETRSQKKHIGSLCLTTIILVSLAVLLDNTITDRFDTAMQAIIDMNTILAQDVYIVGLVITGFYLSNKKN